MNSSILEIHFPVDTLLIKPVISDTVHDVSAYKFTEPLEVQCTPECMTQLLALAVDHIDILLEDWYPTLGTRFVHTSEGKFLVTRLVPCPKCLASALETEQSSSVTTDNQQHHSSSDQLESPHKNVYEVNTCIIICRVSNSSDKT